LFPDPARFVTAAASNADPAELAKFGELAHRWWDPQGEFRPLHALNPLRLDWIDRLAPLSGKDVLDVGCGGGILAESMARRGARVTGIDLSEKPLRVAQLHLQESGLAVDYRLESAEDHAAGHPARYDVVTCMELLEHVPDPSSTVAACAQLLKPGGRAFLMVYNALSYLRWIKWPRQTLRAARAPAQARPPSGSDAESYDFDTAGRAAPETVFVSRAQLASMMQRFSRVDLVLENCSDVRLLGVTLVRRGALIPTLGRFAGLDIYASAVK